MAVPGCPLHTLDSGLILLCGIPSEPPLARVRHELEDMGIPHVVFNQRLADGAHLEFGSNADDAGTFAFGGDSFDLDRFSGAYTRMMDIGALPQMGDRPLWKHPTARVHDDLVRWLEVAPCRVVNRSGPMASNRSKPFQAQVITGFGFATPRTLITNDPDAVRAFLDDCGRVIYKSISGTRSIVTEISDSDLQRLGQIRWCPVQFQERVEGLDVRVHVIDDGVFATAIHSEGTDYRYTERTADNDPVLNEYELDDTIAAACVALTRYLGLAFSGIDLRIAADSTVYCFEVNPSPAFSFYESHTGQPIARAVATYLAGD